MVMPAQTSIGITVAYHFPGAMTDCMVSLEGDRYF